MKRSLPIAVFLVATLAAGCTTRYIGNTLIEDSETNRDILLVVEQYRRAVEDRDIQRILDLTSDEFFEDPGTPGDPTDDYDKAGLRQRLEQSFAQVEDQRLRIEPRKITLSDNGQKAAVEYRFSYRYRLSLGESREWNEQVDLNRVVLVREGGDWKFLSGL